MSINILKISPTSLPKKPGLILLVNQKGNVVIVSATSNAFERMDGKLKVYKEKALAGDRKWFEENTSNSVENIDAWIEDPYLDIVFWPMDVPLAEAMASKLRKNGLIKTSFFKLKKIA